MTTTRDVPIELEGFCARCHDHAVLAQDPDDPESEWLTECCGARLLPLDVEPGDL